MDYMIINGFNTSSLPGCVVTDFGKVEAAKPKGEKATLYGVNGSYRVLDGSFDSYERTFTLHVKKMITFWNLAISLAHCFMLTL